MEALSLSCVGRGGFAAWLNMLSAALVLVALQTVDAFTMPLPHAHNRAARVQAPLVMKGPADAIGPLYRKRFDKKTGKFVRELVVSSQGLELWSFARSLKDSVRVRI